MVTKAEKQYNTFVKGIITEASPLTFPENASIDEDNFVLERTGTRSRRLGADYEDNYALTATGLNSTILASAKVSFHRWDAPSGDISVSIGIVRISDRLWFFNLLNTTPSTSLLNSSTYITISGLGTGDIETATINNNLILVGKDLPYPILLTYNTSTQAVSQQQLLIKVRDLFGVKDNLGINERPTTLSTNHKYNLRNQGWSPRIQTSTGVDAIDKTYTDLSVYPANSDLWTLGKDADINSSTFDKYVPAILNKNAIDNALVSKGSYIIDVFNRGSSRTTVSGISVTDVDKENGAFSTVTSYASRIFYSGVVSSITGSTTFSPKYGGFIFFTQVITSDDALTKCYQEADPTSPDISDLVTTDGGAIQIPEATQIKKIINSKQSLIAFAENGVWEIYGDAGGFTATSYQLSKISSSGITNPKSVVEINGSIVYWSKAGIYLLTQDSLSGRYTAKNISLTTIQTLYNNIPEIAKNHSKGYYDEKENRVRWMYNDTASYSESNYINTYNRELILDITLQAFYTNTIEPLASNSPYICDYIDIPAYTVSLVDSNIYVNNDNVIITNTNQIIISVNSQTSRSSQFSFLTLSGTSFTFSKYKNRSFVDWFTADSTGINFSSYLVTGYELFGDILRNKQVPNIFFQFERTEDGFIESGGILSSSNPSSCLVQAQWNWTNSAAAGKWGTPFQAYRYRRNYIPTGAADNFDTGDRVIETKSKLRGSGKALSLKIYSEAGKDLRLIGWGFPITGDTVP